MINAKKARALRESIGFVPGAPRQYESDRPIQKTVIRAGIKTTTFCAGTMRATGARQQYQKAKRAGLARLLTGGRP